jgi:hypothetical protein
MFKAVFIITRQNYYFLAPLSRSRSVSHSMRPGMDAGSALEASLNRDIPLNNKSSAAEAATERSEGVAGAERLQAPGNLPQGKPSIRAKRVVGGARRAEIDCVIYAE